MVIEGLNSVLFSPSVLFFNLFGTLVGIIFGAIPGLSAVMAMVLFMPISFGLNTYEGISLLLGLYVGGISGGMISAILLKIPGTPVSMTTVFDGGPMADKGEAGKALGGGVLFSFIGGILSAVFLVFLAQPLANIAILFGPFEYCSITIMSLTIVASLAGKSMINGLLSGLFGIWISCIGTSPVGSQMRFLFGQRRMMSGISTVALLLGLFAIAEIISSVGKEVPPMQKAKYTMKGFGFSFKEFRGQIWNCIRSSLIGIIIGILPGLGGNTSSLFAYSVAKDSSDHPEKFGTGVFDGVVASESANNANTGGAMIPMLALGIPGNTPTALLIAALTVKGVTCGPLVFQKNGPLVYGIFASFFLANIFVCLLEWQGLKLFVRILDVPKYILYPLITSMCMLGAFSDRNRIFEMYLVCIIGILAFFLKRFGLQLAPCVIGYILGPMLEQNFAFALSLNNGDLTPLFTKPLSCTFLILAAFMVAYVIKKNVKKEDNTLADNDDY
jgi:putative tricarboxylic transport membrane protein